MKSTAPKGVGPANAAGAADAVADGAAVCSTSPVEAGATVDVGDGAVVAETQDARRLADIASASRFMRQMLAEMDMATRLSCSRQKSYEESYPSMISGVIRQMGVSNGESR